MGAEIDMIEILDEINRIRVARAVLMYILFPALYRSICCTERPLVVARHQIGTQLRDLRYFRLPASYCLKHSHLLQCASAGYHLVDIIFKTVVPDLLVRILSGTKI